MNLSGKYATRRSPSIGKGEPYGLASRPARWDCTTVVNEIALVPHIVAGEFARGHRRYRGWWPTISATRWTKRSSARTNRPNTCISSSPAQCSCKLLSDGRRQVGAFYLPGDVFGLESGPVHRLAAETVIDTALRLVKHSTREKAAGVDAGVAHKLWMMTAGELTHSRDGFGRPLATSCEPHSGLLRRAADRAAQAAASVRVGHLGRPFHMAPPRLDRPENLRPVRSCAFCKRWAS